MKRENVMDNSNANFSLVTINSALLEQQAVEKILACNTNTKRYGLALNEQQALALVQTRISALKENKRVEFCDGIVDKLISSFCDSPYISQDNYESTLHELINLFYELKNSTWDTISDCNLIDFMNMAFNSYCNGSLELLFSEATRLSKHIHCGGSIEDFKPKED